MVWKQIAMLYYSKNDVKRRFNLSYVTKVSAQTFARGCKNRIQLRKTLYKFPDFIKRKYFTLIDTLKMTILINCTGKFCYGHRNFQNTEAVTGGVFKSFRKSAGKHLCQNLFFNIVPGLGPEISLTRHSDAGVFL